MDFINNVNVATLKVGRDSLGHRFFCDGKYLDGSAIEQVTLDLMTIGSRPYGELWDHPIGKLMYAAYREGQ